MASTLPLLPPMQVVLERPRDEVVKSYLRKVGGSELDQVEQRRKVWEAHASDGIRAVSEAAVPMERVCRDGAWAVMLYMEMMHGAILSSG